MLDERRSLVLQALVEEYIRTGQPVSSQAVLERSDLAVSSATVRNDLAKLESYGFVAQPHTSAGRIPTPSGYRYYVDHCSPARLRSATRARIESFFAEVHRGLSKLLKETSGLLSDISHYPAVVIGPGFGSETVRGVHLVHLGAATVLVVMVADNGRVSQEIVRLRFDPSDRELADAERFLNTWCCGKTPEEGAAAISRVQLDEAAESIRSLLHTVADAMRRDTDTASDVFVGGHRQLGALWEDLANVSAVLDILEQESTLRELIDDRTGGTAVRIGSELEMEGVDLAVVSTPYEAGEHGTGRVGVIGPMRMDYRRTIRIVEEVGEGLADSLGS
jgi:heat-inducible transcriptional repressor